MSIMRLKVNVFLVVAVMACMTMSVAADPFTVAYDWRTGLAAGQWFTVKVEGKSYWTEVGVYDIAVSQTDPGDRVTDGMYRAFCIDVWEFSGVGTDYSDVALDEAPNKFADGMGLDKAGQIAYLLDEYWNDGYLMGPDVNKRAAALQIAIWEIVSEAGGYDLAAGHFCAGAAPTDIKNLASGWLDSLGVGNTANYVALTSGSKQDYVVRIPVLVPLPGAALLGMLGLGYAGMRLRRRCA